MISSLNSLDKHIAEGTSEHLLSTTSRYRPDQLQRSQLRRMIVLDVITDPKLLSEAFIAKMEHELGVRQASLLRSVPRDSVIAISLRSNVEPESSPPILLLPMLSHVRMPIRPGEHVFAMLDDVEDIGSVGYWLSRVPSVDHVDDPNIMHHPREHDTSFAQDIRDLDKVPRYDFSNSVLDRDGISIGETSTLLGDEAAYESLVTGSLAGGLRVIEPTPRYFRRVDDLTLEGARGALVVIGSERSGAAYKAGDAPSRLDEDQPSSAAIHLSVGRARDNKKIKSVQNSLGLFENAKDRSSLSASEGDPDFVSDGAYIHVSSRSPIDRLVNLSEPAVKLGTGVAAVIALKADDLRIFSRRSARISVIGSKKRDDGTLADDERDDTFSDICVSGESGDASVLIARDIALKSGRDASMSSRRLSVKASDSIALDADKISVGGEKHPAPAFDTFCSSLADMIDALTKALSAGTSGSPAAQKLNGAEAFAIAAQTFITNLRSVSNAAGPFASQKVKNG